MATSRAEWQPVAVDVACTERALQVQLSDGRRISIPLSWFPRLERATPEQRRNWQLICDGEGIHWPDIDEDLGVEDLFSFDLKPLTERQADWKSPLP